MNWIRASELQRDLFTPAVNATVMNGFEAQEVGGKNSGRSRRSSPPGFRLGDFLISGVPCSQDDRLVCGVGGVGRVSLLRVVEIFRSTALLALLSALLQCR